MKNDITNTILVFAVGCCVVLDVFFALRAINHQRTFRTLSIQAAQAQGGLMHLQQLGSLFNDTRAYNQLHPSPELTRALSELQPRTATR